MLNEILSGNFTYLIALFAALSVHEFAHAFAADRLGDPTAKLAGRLTLNPLAHLDPLGTLSLLFFKFGWGKPVPVDPFNLRRPTRDSALISLAGPAANFLLALGLSGLLHLGYFSLEAGFLPVSLFLQPFIVLNLFLSPIIIICIYLGLFNLLPVSPLDGFAIAKAILPERYRDSWENLSGYGPMILLALLFFPFGNGPIVSSLLSPVISLLFGALLL